MALLLLGGLREVVHCGPKTRVLLPFYAGLPKSGAGLSNISSNWLHSFKNIGFTRCISTHSSKMYGAAIDFKSFSTTKKLMCLTAGSVLFIGLSYRSSLKSLGTCKSLKYSTDAVSSDIPALKLYQYRTCPYCCKARAYLDYAGFKYEVVEVNPLTRKEMKFSAYRKVPFVVGGGVQINDSSLVISVLQSYLVQGGSQGLAKILDKYPEMSTTDKKGKAVKERGNMYFIMFGEKGGAVNLAEKREEREWRQWVDDKLVHVIPPNIYRSPGEAVQAFDYISRVSNFGNFERFAAKYIGAVSMYVLSKSLKKKYKLKPDVRQSLYDYCNKWTGAVGPSRKFMGGSEPNLADLAVYGVLSSVEGLDTFKDMMANTSIGPWYNSVKDLVHGNDIILSQSTV